MSRTPELETVAEDLVDMPTGARDDTPGDLDATSRQITRPAVIPGGDPADASRPLASTVNTDNDEGILGAAEPSESDTLLSGTETRDSADTNRRSPRTESEAIASETGVRPTGGPSLNGSSSNADPCASSDSSDAEADPRPTGRFPSRLLDRIRDSIAVRNGLLALKVNIEEEDNYREEGEDLGGSWKWTILLVALLEHIITGGLCRVSGVLYLLLQDKFPGAAAGTAWTFSLFNLMVFVTGPMVNVMCNKFSCKTVVFLGGILSFFGILVSAVVPSVGYMYLTFGILAGMGRSMTTVPSMVHLLQYFRRRRGLILGVATAGAGVGAACFPALVDNLYNWYGFLGTFMILAVISLQSCVSAALLRSLPRRHKRPDKVVKDAKFTKKGNEPTAFKLPGRRRSSISLQMEPRSPDVTIEYQFQYPKLKQMMSSHWLKNLKFLSSALVVVLYSLATTANQVFLPSLAMSRGLSIAQATYVLATIGACDTVFRVLYGILFEIKSMNRFRVLVYSGALLLLGCCSVILPSMHGLLRFAVVGAVYGCCTGSILRQRSLVAMDIGGIEQVRFAFGFSMIFQGVGCIIGPPVAGILKDNVGQFAEGFYFTGVSCLLGSLVLLFGTVWSKLRHTPGYQ